MSTWFPELAPIAELVDDAVIDGEIILGNAVCKIFCTGALAADFSLGRKVNIRAVPPALGSFRNL